MKIIGNIGNIGNKTGVRTANPDRRPARLLH